MTFGTSREGTKQVRLGPRECELLQQICAGRTPANIAFSWKKSPASIYADIHRLTQGLQISGVRELFVWGITHTKAVEEPGARVDVGPHRPECECWYCLLMSRLRGMTNGRH